MDKNDLFRKDIEEKMSEMKYLPPKKEKTTGSEKMNKIFSIVLGLVILIGILSTILGVLGR